MVIRVTIWIATVLACLINPYGIEGLKLPFLLFGEVQGSIFRVVISELQSPFQFSGGFIAVFYYKVLIVLCVGTGLWNLRRLDLFWGLLCLSQFYLSTLSLRSLPLFCLAAVPGPAGGRRRRGRLPGLLEVGPGRVERGGVGRPGASRGLAPVAA